jgi:peptidoglycan hydrolase CwlO-like protein
MEKTEIPGVYKERDGILINRDNQALAAYKKRMRKEKAIDDMQNEMTELKNDMQEIKELLKGLVK